MILTFFVLAAAISSPSSTFPEYVWSIQDYLKSAKFSGLPGSYASLIQAEVL